MSTASPSQRGNPARRSRRRALGMLGYAAAGVFAMLTVAATTALFGGDMNPIAGALVVVTALVLTLGLWILAEQCLVPSASDVLAMDPRAPVVYLRPFGEDRELTYDVISAGETSTPITAKAEDFLLELNAIGPLVSIAEPNRRARLGLHPLGVHRDFVGEGDWQARVQSLLDRAGLVVLAMGDSAGIEWEIAQVRARIAPQSLLLYLPPRPVAAWTRKGRHTKEAAIYAHFAPLVEKHFDLTMPPFSASTYLIGFDADGQPVLAPTAPRKRWVFTEHGRVADAIRSQLRAILAQVRPDIALDHAAIAGRAGLWWRLAGLVALVLASIAVALAGGPIGPLSGLVGAMMPDLMLLLGWVLLARDFRRRWVWAIPVLLGALVALNLAAQIDLRWYGGEVMMTYGRSLAPALGWLLRLAYAGAVLALGLALLGRQTEPD